MGGDKSNGDTGFIRIDATNIWDAHSLAAFDNFAKDGGTVDLNSTGPATVDRNSLPARPVRLVPPLYFFPGDPTSYLNFIRDPSDPFEASATLPVYNYASFTNNGAGVEWIPDSMTSLPRAVPPTTTACVDDGRPDDGIDADHLSATIKGSSSVLDDNRTL